MTKKKANHAPASGTVLFIPLNKLKKSPRNARKTPHPKGDIAALAASIAANGMLQSPVVEPEHNADGVFTGSFLVTIGEGRRQAQLLRAKRKEITKAEPVRCAVQTGDNSLEISLAENAIRSAMHPADQFEAFHTLHTEQGMNAEDIAARFGVTPAVVKQRLKLAVISPVLMQAYRDEQVNLDELTAFAFTDDHAKQEHVWEELGADVTRAEILAALNGEHVSATDRRAAFVGLEAYQAAGGAIARDLFDDENEGFLTDAKLLDQLAKEKLEQMAEAIRAEGWKWVEVLTHYDYSAVAEMRRVYPNAPALTDEADAKIEALEAGLAALERGDEGDEASAEAERLEQEIATLRGDDVFDPGDVACAGAIITIGHSGEPRIERGFVRREDDARRTGSVKAKANSEGPAPISETLAAELTAYRTAALRCALAQHSAAALRTVVHALAEQAFFDGPGSSCLRISLREVYLQPHAKGIAESAAETEMVARHETWAKRLPSEMEGLWDFVGTLSLAEQIDLLAHCASLALDTVQVPKQNRVHNGDAVAACIGFDMTAAWEPSADNYLGRVSKERILEAVREGVSKEAADNIASMKKRAMAEAAAERLRGKRWLPPILRPSGPARQAAE